jgi:hypothetical protein
MTRIVKTLNSLRFAIFMITIFVITIKNKIIGNICRRARLSPDPDPGQKLADYSSAAPPMPSMARPKQPGSVGGGFGLSSGHKTLSHNNRKATPWPDHSPPGDPWPTWKSNCSHFSQQIKHKHGKSCFRRRCVNRFSDFGPPGESSLFR